MSERENPGRSDIYRMLDVHKAIKELHKELRPTTGRLIQIAEYISPIHDDRWHVSMVRDLLTEIQYLEHEKSFIKRLLLKHADQLVGMGGLHEHEGNLIKKIFEELDQ